jgi:transposase
VGISTALILDASQRDERVLISQSRSLPAGYVFRAKLILMKAPPSGRIKLQARNHGSDHYSVEGAFPVRWHRRVGHVSSRPAAERSDARLARPDSGRHSEKASRWIDALEFCVDEKTPIQALDRLDPVLPLSPAAPSVTGLNTTVMARCRCTRNWIRNPAKCSARPPPATPDRSLWSSSQRWSNGPAREVHIILDNLPAHKSQVVRDFLAAHPNVHFHFTPTYSSRPNQVEIWFSKVERDVIARGIFTSVKDLACKLRRYITPTQRTLSRSSGNIPIRPAASAVTLSLRHAVSSSQIVIVMRYVSGS